jgi:hypothetical protein
MLSMQSLDSFKCRRTLQAGGKSYEYYSLKAAEENGLEGISACPPPSRCCWRTCCATRTAAR